MPIRLKPVAICALFAPFAIGCDTPKTNVVLDNNYPPSQTNALVIYQGAWQAISFSSPVSPGSSSDPVTTLPASPNTAYVLLAPGWSPTADGGPSTPSSFIVLQSRSGFEVHLNDTLHIPVDDTNFAGNCVGGSFLTQEQADFITERVFASAFAGLIYDAASCTTIGLP